jgi:hypothetical protein
MPAAQHSIDTIAERRRIVCLTIALSSSPWGEQKMTFLSRIAMNLLVVAFAVAGCAGLPGGGE